MRKKKMVGWGIGKNDEFAFTSSEFENSYLKQNTNISYDKYLATRKKNKMGIFNF